MAREIQFAYAAAELARQDANLAETNVDPERTGVVLGAGIMHGALEELVDAFEVCATETGFDFSQWGEKGIRQFFPLWMLKYLPNMPACHIAIRQDARGPNNTIAHGDVSSLLALSEATNVIRRGQADVMYAGGASSRLSISDLVWHGGAQLAQSTDPPETICRPFDADRQGMVLGEGSAMFVLESASHAQRRGATPLARIAAIASRNEASTDRQPPGKAIAGALAAALQAAELPAGQLGHINAHGSSTLDDDRVEARAIAQVLGDNKVPVTAPKSYFGNLGPGSGAVELAVSLLAMQQGVVPATLNHQQTDPSCPVHVVTSPQAALHPTFAALNHASTGQAVAAIFMAESS